jgi:hypothetical protein
MSRFFNAKADGFNIIVISSDPDNQVIQMVRRPLENTSVSDRPIFWGSDEMGTLTPEENKLVRTMIPEAAHVLNAPEVVPPKQSHSLSMILSMFIGCAVGGGAVYLGTLLGA